MLAFQHHKNHLNQTSVTRDIGKTLSRGQTGQSLDKFASQYCNSIFHLESLRTEIYGLYQGWRSPYYLFRTGIISI